MPVALVVDDDLALLKSVQSTAEIADLDLVVADNWDLGLALFQVLNPALVIADYNMPNSRHGLQLLVQMRRLAPAVRVVLISGYLSENDLAKVRALDLVDDVMTKGTAVESARSIVDQVGEASSPADTGTEWHEYARGYIRMKSISDTALDELDAMLAGRVERQGDDA